MEIKTNKIMKAFVKKSGDKWMAEEVITHVPYEIMQDYIPLKEGQVVWGRIVEHSNQDRIHQKYFELQNPPPKVSELATLRAESQAKDTRIKELVEYVRDYRNLLDEYQSNYELVIKLDEFLKPYTP